MVFNATYTKMKSFVRLNFQLSLQTHAHTRVYYVVSALAPFFNERLCINKVPGGIAY